MSFVTKNFQNNVRKRLGPGRPPAELTLDAPNCDRMTALARRVGRVDREDEVIHRQVFHNDRLLPIEQVRLSPGQAGLLSGWGLFTTLRIAGGVPFAYERHWKRLEKDAARTHCPFPFDAQQVRSQLYEVLQANNVLEGTARIYAIFNQPGFWSSEEKFRPA